MSLTPYYQDEYATIYHGDCREILPQLGPVGVVVTDPPYGVGFEYQSYEDTAEQWQSIILPVCLSLINESPAAICMSFRNLWHLPKPKWSLCWYKPGSTRRSNVKGFSIWEPISLYGDGWSFANDAIALPDVVNHSRGNTHPCPKPLALFRYILKGAPAGVILDPFMGSGTTLRAAKDLGIKSIGIEIEEKYCEIAAKRLAQEVFNFEAAS